MDKCIYYFTIVLCHMLEGILSSSIIDTTVVCTVILDETERSDTIALTEDMELAAPVLHGRERIHSGIYGIFYLKKRCR
jgi:hypothetical protein